MVWQRKVRRDDRMSASRGAVWSGLMEAVSGFVAVFHRSGEGASGFPHCVISICVTRGRQAQLGCRDDGLNITPQQKIITVIPNQERPRCEDSNYFRYSSDTFSPFAATHSICSAHPIRSVRCFAAPAEGVS